ncbi:MAG: hypothetical protein ACYTET_05740 [Planctomycetota bacterium]|jgi:hypothetical protein
MADNYYSMQEVMGKLRKAEAEVQDLVKQGKLRQYMDAGNAVFKVEDVDTLTEEIVGLDLSSAGISLDGGSELDLELEETAEVPLESELFDEVEEILPQADTIGETPELVDETLGIMPEADEVQEVAEAPADDTLDIMPDAPATEEPAQVDETLGLELEETNAPAEPEAPALVDETIGLEMEPEEEGSKDDADMELELDESKIKESEGGFGLSQMGDLTMADTNVGTVGINILSGTEDAFKLTDDTKSETVSADAEEIDELESLDADANMESFGSGSGLLDLSLQADDTSLGAVLDDILPAGAEEGGDLPVAGGLMDEEDLLADSAPATGDAEVGAAAPAAAVTAPMGTATAAATAPLPGTQMVAAAVVDPKTNIYGVAMFLPLIAVILAGVVMTAAVQDVTPSLMTKLIGNGPADISMIWLISAGLAVAVLIILAFAAMLGGGGGGGSKVKKTKKAKKEKPKKKKRK